MINLSEIIKNYFRPSDVKELMGDYAQFHESLVPSYVGLPLSIRKLLDRAYELGASQFRFKRAAGEVPVLEEKVETLQRKYERNTVYGALISTICVSGVVADIVLNANMKDAFPNAPEAPQFYQVAKDSLTYLMLVGGIISLVHAVRSLSALVTVKDVKYHIDTLLKNVLKDNASKDRGPTSDN